LITKNAQKIHFYRQHIPPLECVAGCHDCCGPVTASSEEVARLPVKSNEEHELALTEWNCVYLGKDGCEVYDERPLICRVFGTIPSLPCPHNNRPEQVLDVKIERGIFKFLAETRQVLL